jgi:DNA-binding transcriptional MerR regulator
MHGYLPIYKVSKLLGVSSDTLRRWDKAGKLTAVRHPITGQRWYKKTDLVQFGVLEAGV